MVRLVVCACLAFWAISADAQAPVAPDPPQRSVAQHPGEASKNVSSKPVPADGHGGVLVGIVADSLHDSPLAGALVTVVQLPRRSVMTSQAGAFRFDSLPPGKYTLDIQHPVIDSLGIQVRSDTLVVTAGQTQTAFLSIPSPARIAAAICSPLQQHLGPAVLAGQVLDADAGTPMVGAEVSVVWLETQASMQTGVHTTPQLRKATVAPDGTFRVCGLPMTLNGTLQASLGAAKTGEIALETADHPLTLKVLRLPSSPSTTATAPPAASPSPPLAQTPVAVTSASSSSSVALQVGSAVVTGRVTNKGGVPVVGAAVTIQGGAAKAVSAKDGTFTLSGAPAGTQLVQVRLVGYDLVQHPLDITTRGPNTLTVRLGEYHPQLATVNVRTKAPQTSLDRTGFPRRKNIGIGHYVTEDDITREQPIFTSDVLRQVLGLHVLGSGQSVSVTTSRGDGCVRYLIDRNNIDPQDGLSIDELVHPADIVGIEFYQASEIPAALSSGANAGCALLVVWTRQKLPPAASNH